MYRAPDGVSRFRTPKTALGRGTPLQGCPQDHLGIIHSPESGYTEGEWLRVALLKRVRVAWTSWPGGPGVSTFHFETEQAPPLADLRSLFATIANYLPSGIVLQVENVGQTIDSTTGKAVAGWSAATVAPITASGGVNYAQPCGAYIQWKSGAFINGREVRGKTFLVPLASAWYDAEGTVHPTAKNAIDGALTTYRVAGGSVQRIFSRATQGVTTINAATVVDKCVVMTSRRAGG